MMPAVLNAAKEKLRRRAHDILWTVGLILLALVISSLLAEPMIDTTNVLMICFLMVIMVARVTTGYWYGIFASLVGVLGVNFYFTYPFSEFNFTITGYPVTFACLLLASVVTSALTSSVKEQTLEAQKRGKQNEALYELAHSLLGLSRPSDVAQTAAAHLGRICGCRAAICVGDPAGGSWSSPVDDPVLLRTAGEAYQTGRQAGLETASVLPIMLADDRRMGVALLWQRTPPETGQPYSSVFIWLVLSQIAMALDYCRLETERHQAMLDAQAEQMRGNLLRAISHDLRTPLTGIYGASATLLETGGQLPEGRRRQLLDDIRENAGWLIRMVENLLSVTRIGQDPSGLSKTPEAAEEIVGAAVANLRKSFPNAAISVGVPDELLMVPMDGTLIQQVLINLMENAVKYSQTDAPVQVAVWQEGPNALFTVTDRGVGLPRERLAHAFDGGAPDEPGGSDARRGMGIGLPICKSIVNAHGGVIRAENLPGGGCRFSFSLPLNA